MSAAARRLYFPTLPPLRVVASSRRWELTFLCDGHAFKVIAAGHNAQAAAAEGVIELAAQCAEFEPDTARMVSAIEVR